jgi:hypothetical protein
MIKEDSKLEDFGKQNIEKEICIHDKEKELLTRSFFPDLFNFQDCFPSHTLIYPSSFPNILLSEIDFLKLQEKKQTMELTCCIPLDQPKSSWKIQLQWKENEKFQFKNFFIAKISENIIQHLQTTPLLR